MPRRQAPPPKDFAFDFTADWRPYAAIPPGSAASFGWTLCGTVTKDRKIRGLAFRNGIYAECNINGLIHPLSALENSHVGLAIEFRNRPGWERVPSTKKDRTGNLIVPPQPTRDPNRQRGHKIVVGPPCLCDACGESSADIRDVGDICHHCGKGEYQHRNLWIFTEWPDGAITATPQEWITEQDVQVMLEQHSATRAERAGISH